MGYELIISFKQITSNLQTLEGENSFFFFKKVTNIGLIAVHTSDNFFPEGKSTSAKWKFRSCDLKTITKKYLFLAQKGIEFLQFFQQNAVLPSVTLYIKQSEKNILVQVLFIFKHPKPILKKYHINVQMVSQHLSHHVGNQRPKNYFSECGLK